MTFSAFESLTGQWWVQCHWSGGYARYGGCSLIWPAPDEETAVAVAADMNERNLK